MQILWYPTQNWAFHHVGEEIQSQSQRFISRVPNFFPFSFPSPCVVCLSVHRWAPQGCCGGVVFRYWSSGYHSTWPLQDICLGFLTTPLQTVVKLCWTQLSSTVQWTFLCFSAWKWTLISWVQDRCHCSYSAWLFSLSTLLVCLQFSGHPNPGLFMCKHQSNYSTRMQLSLQILPLQGAPIICANHYLI